MLVGVETIERNPSYSAGHFLPPADNTYDLGSATMAWRNIYVDTLIYVTGTVLQGDFLPSVQGTYDIGSSTYPWAELYIGNTSNYLKAIVVSNVPTLYGVGAYLRVGDAATTQHSLDSEDALFVTGKLEVGGISYFDGDVVNAGYVGLLVTDTDGTTEGEIWYDASENTMKVCTGSVDSVVLLTATQELSSKTFDSCVGKGTWTASGTWTLPAWTTGGNITMAEETSVLLDGVLSADGKWSAIVAVTGTAGTNLDFANLVYFAVGDSKWEKTDADAAATAIGLIGIVVVAALEDATATIMLIGTIRADAAFPALTIGAPVHVGVALGEVQVAAPSGSGDIVRIIGHAITADSMFFNPDGAYVTIA